MTKSEVFVRIMDEAARRVLSGNERPYVVANETAGELVHLDGDSDSVASWTAYVLWLQISDMFDMPGGPESEDLCDEFSEVFSRGWLALVNREDEAAQQAFMAEFDVWFTKRVAEYRAANVQLGAE